MKQILQNLRTGVLEVADVPAPVPRPGHLLINTRCSLISAGTERMLVEFSQANLLQKARSQPEKVRQVLDKIAADGLLPTMETVFNKLDEPLPLGYCNAGVIVDSGGDPSRWPVGARVAGNGPHAEFVSVPYNLCALIPDNVPDADAAFTVLGAIALQGIRLAAPAFGEKFVVFGLGLVGLLAVQLLRAHGCEVLGVDFNETRLKLAESFGAATVNPNSGGDPVKAAMSWTRHQGVDGVLIAASSRGDSIMQQAAEACRKRGRIVLVGVVDLNLRRDMFFKKELSFQVSCSYGPGRYDEKYELAGQDYPLGYVRWTEQRNFAAVLQALSSGALNVNPLISHRHDLDDAVAAYALVQHDPEALGVVLEYSSPASAPTNAIRAAAPVALRAPAPTGRAVVGVIGAGGYAKGILLPCLAKTDARLAYIADLNGAAAAHAARKFKAEQAVTDYRRILDDPAVNTVFVVVPHNLHARLVCEGLAVGKHVFVEKPLCLSAVELDEINNNYAKARGKSFLQLMVGFNRRFSPHAVRIKELLAGRAEPICINMTINAGALPPDHWLHDQARGGGRIIGEGCHFLDLMMFLCDAPIASVASVMIGNGPAVREDKMSIQLEFADGSLGVVNYFANGAKRYPKETLEIFSDGRVLRLDNFRLMQGWGWRGFRKFKTWRQDKGHAAEIAAFIVRVKSGGDNLIPFDQLANVARASFGAVRSAMSGERVRL